MAPTGVSTSRNRLRPFLPCLVVAALLVPGGGAGAAMPSDELIGGVVVEHGDDFAGRRSHESRFIETGRGRFALAGPGAERATAGTVVRVRGTLRGNTLTVAADGTGTTGVQTLSGDEAAPDVAAATIVRRVAVLLINFSPPTTYPSPTPTPTPSPSPGASASPASSSESTSPSPTPTATPTPTPTPSPSPLPTPTPTPTPSPSPSPTPTPPVEPWTASYVGGIYFTNQKSVASYFGEVSNGAMSISGDVFGYFTLPVDTTSCNYTEWALAARSAAAAAGIDLSKYTNVVHAFGRQQSCGWGGMAQVPGKYSWINGSMSVYVTSHELGHNFGAHHASTMTCTKAGLRVTYSSNCTTNEYGDPFDVMGTNAQRHMHTWHRRQVGFLSVADQQTVTANGHYFVATAEVAGGLPRILRVTRPAGGFYYLEFRQPYGLYDNFLATAAATNGVMIRIAPDTKRVQSRLIDATPATTSFGDAAFGVGQTFSDDIDGITITTVAIGSTGANLRIQVGPDRLAPTTPTALTATLATPTSIALNWSPSTDELEVVGYRISRDGLPLATVGGMTHIDSDLAQGATYTYAVEAIDGGGNASTPATLAMDVPDTLAPATPASVSALQVDARGATITWLPATDNVGVTSYDVHRDGALIATTSELGVADSALIDGFSYLYEVSARDAAGNVGPSSSSSLYLPDVTPPSATTAFSATPVTPTTASLSWAPASDNVAVLGYLVQRDGTLVATLPATATSFVESGLASDTAYTYAVQAIDAAGNVAPAQTGLVRLVSVDTIAPTVPQELRGTSLARRYISLTWEASTDDREGTIRYRVFRGTTRIATVTTTSYVDRPAYTGKYTYKVRAVDAAGNNSAFTPAITVRAVKTI